MRGPVGDWTEGAGQTGRGGVEDGEMETAALTPAPAAAPTAVNTKHSHKCGIMLKLIHSIDV